MQLQDEEYKETGQHRWKIVFWIGHSGTSRILHLPYDSLVSLGISCVLNYLQQVEDIHVQNCASTEFFECPLYC